MPAATPVTAVTVTPSAPAVSFAPSVVLVSPPAASTPVSTLPVAAVVCPAATLSTSSTAVGTSSTMRTDSWLLAGSPSLSVNTTAKCSNRLLLPAPAGCASLSSSVYVYVTTPVAAS